MARIEVNGLELDYEMLGREGAPALVLTPGGRFPRDTPGVPELGAALAEAGYRVLLWDRPGCGASDIAFTAPTESVMNAEALVGLVKALKLGPVRLAAGSAGSRVSLMAAARMPEQVEKIAIWWISGGPVCLAGLAWYYCGDQIDAAAKGGMAAVAALPSWADQTRRNPRIRDILLRQDPETFIDTMQRWAKGFAYRDDTPVPGMEPVDFAKLTMPVLTFRSGISDMSHLRETSQWTHAMLPNSRLVEPPWGDQEWNEQLTKSLAGEAGLFCRWPLLAPQLIDFFGE